MNREIKFRAWNELDSRKEERMIYHATLTAYGKVIMPNGEGWKIPVMQYTGLKDKNRKEIYEGDIFQDEEDGYYDFVEWDEVENGWTTHTWYRPDEIRNLEDMEIIGNIYENPELLNNKN